MRNRRLYVAGCGGMLGEAFHAVFAADNTLRATDLDVNEPWLSRVDVRDFAAYRRDVLEFGPECLVHLAALTSLEECERHPEEAYATNTLAAEHAVHIANELGIPLVYVSSAGVFDGRQEAYDDWDVPNPLGHYARSKLLGEQYVAGHAARYFVCRAGWMMGGGPGKDKKFVQKLMAQLRAGRTELHVVDDKLGTPTYTRDFARNVGVLAATRLWGTYNMVCDGATGRLEVARELVRLAGKEREVRVIPVSSAHFAREYFAARPASERLVARKLTLRGLNVMRHWRVCLAEYLRESYAGYL